MVTLKHSVFAQRVTLKHVFAQHVFPFARLVLVEMTYDNI